MNSKSPSYHGYRFPPEIISHAVWLYHRFCMSFRDVEDLLAQRGITVSYEANRPTPLEALPRVESAARPARAPATFASWLPPSDGLAPVGERLTPTPSDSASHASPCTSRAATRSSARQLIVACEEIRIRPAEESSIQEGIFRPAPVVGSRTVTAPSPCGGDVSTSSSCP